MPHPHPNDHAKWKTRPDDDDLAAREVAAYEREAANLDNWTVGLLNARRCTLWAFCPTCETQKVVSIGDLMDARLGAVTVKNLPLKCSVCRGRGQPIVKWVSPNRSQCFHNFTTGEHKGAWRGAYPFKASNDAVGRVLKAAWEAKKATEDGGG